MILIKVNSAGNLFMLFLIIQISYVSENFTKLLVAAGSSQDLMTVEIIDLSDENMICEPLTDFPIDPYQAGNAFVAVLNSNH